MNTCAADAALDPARCMLKNFAGPPLALGVSFHFVQVDAADTVGCYKHEA